ncbi:hypothetical protein C4D60_Mb11t14250 [Musa balbisiana]|uniref:Uncharacterized protein n=1 Tax=Musa balbisiana TaxID=52838 RepID=A0A4S8J414_MUSBA|nr:hypothetical protein C4D60_Mb11t14250 [Musa balbisiana]
MVSSSSSSSSSSLAKVGKTATVSNPNSSPDEKAARALEALIDGGSPSPARGEDFIGRVDPFAGRGEGRFEGGAGGRRGWSPSEEGEGSFDEAGHPRKKVRVLLNKASGLDAAQPAGAVVVLADRAGGSLGGGEASTSGEAPRQPSIRELCRLSTGGEDEPYQTRVMGDLPRGEASDPLVARWEGLTRGSRVWADGDSAAGFVRGGLHPDIARDLYTLPSEVLLSRSAKSLLWVSVIPPVCLHGNHYAVALMDHVRDAGRVVAILGGRNADLRRQLDEVRTRGAPEAVATAEQRASDLDAEVTRLRSKLKASEERNMELQTHLKAFVAEARSARGDSLELIRRLEEARAEARGASEALDAEIRQRPEKDKKLLEDYKDSSGFQLGLVRTGRVSYEYGYRIALACFKARHPDLEVTEDPFDSFPKDMSVDMPDEVPFDDSLDAPEE